MANILRGTVAPNLPISPTQFNQIYEDQYSNVLRLYFNQIDNFTTNLTNPNTGGGALLSFPYGAFHQDGTTTLSANMTNVSTAPISVASTAGFFSSGYLLIESEIIQYTGITATTFTGITRGVLGTTNVAHTAGVSITETQGTGSSTTIGILKINNTDYSNGVTISATDNTRMVFTYPGLYNVQFSAQLLNYTTTDDNVTIWNRLNGVDIPFSAGIEQVNSKHGSAPGSRIASWNFYQYFNTNDYLQICFTSDSGNSVIATYPAGTSPVHPVSPALILTAQFVSA